MISDVDEDVERAAGEDCRVSCGNKGALRLFARKASHDVAKILIKYVIPHRFVAFFAAFFIFFANFSAFLFQPSKHRR